MTQIINKIMNKIFSVMFNLQMLNTNLKLKDYENEKSNFRTNRTDGDFYPVRM